jgi:hypothetical protein
MKNVEMSGEGTILTGKVNLSKGFGPSSSLENNHLKGGTHGSEKEGIKEKKNFRSEDSRSENPDDQNGHAGTNRGEHRFNKKTGLIGF